MKKNRFSIEHEFDDAETYIVDNDADIEEDENNDLLVTLHPAIPWPIRTRIARFIVAELEKEQENF
jgi:hypothetical protein